MLGAIRVLPAPSVTLSWRDSSRCGDMRAFEGKGRCEVFRAGDMMATNKVVCIHAEGETAIKADTNTMMKKKTAENRKLFLLKGSV